MKDDQISQREIVTSRSRNQNFVSYVRMVVETSHNNNGLFPTTTTTIKNSNQGTYQQDTSQEYS